jgi:predicted MFS family arabinose efflux permease
MHGVDASPTGRNKVLLLLFLANLLNFFDRTLPAVVIEPIRLEFGLSDLQLGLLSTSFVVVYAIAGVPLGRLADTGSRRRVLAWGLATWSAFTGFAGLAWSYSSLLLIRMGVGVGEACYAPAANSLIGDLYPPHQRARAVGLFMLGLPLGLLLAFFTVGPLVQALGSWRAPFFLAAVPGLLLAVMFLRIVEPARGSADAVAMVEPVRRPIRSLLRIPTLWWIIFSGLGLNFATYPTSSFLVPLLQRHFGLGLAEAAIHTGVIVGATGLVGLTAGGAVADRMHRASERGRLLFGAVMMVAAAAFTAAALALGADSVAIFVSLFAVGWLACYTYYTCVYPAVQDVVEPRLRATAMALYFAAMYLLGGAAGPAVVGAVSDHLAHGAMLTAGAAQLDEVHRAAGLYGAMFLVPFSLGFTAVCVFLAALTFPRDARAMRAGQGVA